MGLALAAKVRVGVTTSSYGATPTRRRARWRPAVPQLRATAGRPIIAEKLSSRLTRFGPTVESQLVSNADRTCVSSVPPMCGTESSTRIGALTEGVEVQDSS